MTGISFRNVDVDRDTPIETWPAEALETMIDRGSLTDWRELATEIRRTPWGRVARIVEDVTSWNEHPGVDALLSGVIADARRSIAITARQREATRLRELRRATGLSLRAFAALAGTSASRLSDYENANVAPTTDAIGRLEHAALIAGEPD